MPRVADKQERRDQVIEAAFRVIARDGLSGTSMRAVAKEAGCTIGLINHWFSSRDDLIEATFDQAITMEMERATQSRRSCLSATLTLARDDQPLQDQ